MLNAETIQTVQATVPALVTHALELTRCFYRLLLDRHPEMRAYFNASNQASGAQAQALADAVLAYARHLDRLDVLGPAVGRIAQKHVAIGVQPQHYPIVGACLLDAMAEVLGELATPAVLQAWGAAYGQLAELFIHTEAEIATARATQTGGWRGTRAFRIARKTRESSLITSFHFEPLDGGPIATYEPGQYLTLQLTVAGVLQRRHYSISDAPGGAHYRISVKREAQGCVSRWLHDDAELGAVLELHAPAGDFARPRSARPLVLVTGGVGITPAMAMLEAELSGADAAAASAGRPIHFVHAARDGSAHAFKARVDELAQRHPRLQRFTVYSAPQPGDRPDATGHLDAGLLDRALHGQRDVDLCFLGPPPFMGAVQRIALRWGLPPQQLRSEFFGPKRALPTLA